MVIPRANSCMLDFAIMIAPAARSFFTGTESSGYRARRPGAWALWRPEYVAGITRADDALAWHPVVARAGQSVHTAHEF